ncbi:hypothetical protein QBC32DRAFT_117373 [Pseudoneurospora amorphoporcata]|uniref:MARVEL domain-containing protein n=1 Tax=Pseudoneurospora amorphoporcata TaxID=241081 RepID=A0AAN6SGI5_9PEZI|nr:hypothetical protein QBC32DRAFT_117373 [Pseudoneurospora amorphoporcata]
MAYSKYSSDRTPGREHIPLYPKGFIAIRIVQLIIAILIAGLSAYGVHFFVSIEDILVLALAIITLTTSTYHLLARFSTAGQKTYNYWAVLALKILLLVLWLASFALLASDMVWFLTLWTAKSEVVPAVDPYYNGFTPSNSGDPYASNSSHNSYGILAALKRAAVGKKSLISGRGDGYGDGRLGDTLDDDGGSSSSSAGGVGGLDEDAVVASLVAPICLVAGAALRAIEFILHLISLIIHSVFVHRHRAAGLHSKPIKSSSSSSSGSCSGGSNTALFSPVPAVTPATPTAAVIPNINEKAYYHHQKVDSTPIAVPHNHNRNQQPQVPSQRRLTPRCLLVSNSNRTSSSNRI